MELQVSVAPGRHDCFAALPAEVIDVLQGRDSNMFSAILELRPIKGDAKQGPWYLAWAGATSTSSSIEVSKNLADCLGLPCKARFNVKALRDVPHARTIELEPVTVNDWEIIELNAGFVEDHILSQVGVLSLGQQFPIWVEGRTVLMLHVLSAEPKGVVKLVPGTELIVAPKVGRISGPKVVPSVDEFPPVKAWLRVQKLHPSLMQRLETGNFICTVAPTTYVFLSEETANSAPFQNGQLVMLTSGKRTAKQKEVLEVEKQEKTDIKVVGNVPKPKSVVLRLFSCPLVAKGHAMLASALCQFIGVPVHSWIQLKSLLGGSMLVSAGAEISPIQFKNAAEDGAVDVSGDSSYKGTASGWEKHRLLLQCMSNHTSIHKHEDPKSRVLEKKQLHHDSESNEGKDLFTFWLAAQAKACLSYILEEECRVVPINQETVMEFSVEPKVAAVCQNGSNGALLERQTMTLDYLLTLEPRDFEHEVTSSSLLPDGSNLLLLDTKSWEGEEGKCGAPLQPIKVGRPKYVPSLWKGSLEDKIGPSLTSLAWLKEPAADALQRLQFCLSPQAQARRVKLGFPSPGYVLLHGPPACGKTKLSLAIARELEEDPSILAHKVVVKFAELVGEQPQAVRGVIQDAVSEAVQCGPCVVIFDDLDVAIPSNSGSESSEPSTPSLVLSEYLSDVLDMFRHGKGHRSGRYIAFLAVARTVSSLPTALCSSGRFDLHVALSAPATKDRAGILSQEIEHRGLVCEEHVVFETASKCDGYDMADLKILVDRAVHAAAPRLLSLSKRQEHDRKPKHELLKEDLQHALEGFLPVSMRDIGRPSGGQVGPSTWEEVGGLHGTCRVLREMLELPAKYPKVFTKAPLRLRTGVLLYGPPGCGKTRVVGIAAAACSLPLISVKGPEILNKYIGASEQGVRDMFAKAKTTAPCILFFDEFDAIAPKRGHDNTGVTDRVVNQLLTELDGVEALNGVFVFAATSRPDLLDAALLRPGRLDRLLLCDFPTASERLEILQVLSRKLPLAEDVRLDVVASLTDNFSGADLQGVLSDAQLEAVHHILSGETDGDNSGKPKEPVITMGVLTSALRKARPSVSEHERRRLYGIYDAFVSSRSSLSAKARDNKGKRATLA